MSETRVAAGLGTAMVVLMGLGLVWASLAGGGLAVLGQMMREPLYLVTLLDLYLGCAIVLAWVWVRQRSVPAVAGWSVVLLLTGNIGAGVYLIIAAMTSRGDLTRLMLGRSAPDGG